MEEAREAEASKEGQVQGFGYWAKRRDEAEAIRIERENDLAVGKLVVKEEVEAAMAEAGKRVMTRLREIPRSIVPQLEGLTPAEMEDLLLREIDNTLTEISDWRA